MELTTAAYVGGQMEIQNSIEGYIYRGEIACIAIADNELRVRFAWLAKGEGYPPLPTRWVNDETLDYVASQVIYILTDFGDGRLAFNCPYSGEVAVLFPPNGSKLDPNTVIGLKLSV